VPARVDALVQRLLAKNPEERFPSAEALAEALREVLEDTAEGPTAGHGVASASPVTADRVSRMGAAEPMAVERGAAPEARPSQRPPPPATAGARAKSPCSA
ncbi:hypothetical protein ACLESO_56350, partial [Pyxidicoccus sp. 3LG]